MDKEIKNRIRGTLIGCAYGDAMGMATEFLSREKINKNYPNGVSDFYASSEDDILGRKFPRGSVTDDTTHTVLICKTIIENNGSFDTYKYIANLTKWMKNNPEMAHYVMGPNTKRVISAIMAGADINETGKYGTTNGTAMKISPIGIVKDYRMETEFIDTVEKVCLPIHHTEVAIAGACCIAACISYAVRGGSDIEEMWKICLRVVEKTKGRGTDFPTASLTERLKQIYKIVKTNSEKDAINIIENLYGAGMETVDSIPAALGIMTLANGDPIKSAIIAANTVGDSDTLGAMSTAICGAMNPVFPAEDVELLKKVNNIDFDYLTDALYPFVQVKR